MSAVQPCNHHPRPSANEDSKLLHARHSRAKAAGVSRGSRLANCSALTRRRTSAFPINSLSCSAPVSLFPAAFVPFGASAVACFAPLDVRLLDGSGDDIAASSFAASSLLLDTMLGGVRPSARGLRHEQGAAGLRCRRQRRAPQCNQDRIRCHNSGSNSRASVGRSGGGLGAHRV